MAIQNGGGAPIVRNQIGPGNRPPNAGRRVVEIRIHQRGTPAVLDLRGAADSADGVPIPPAVGEVPVVGDVRHIVPSIRHGTGLEDQDRPARLGELQSERDAGRTSANYVAVVAPVAQAVGEEHEPRTAYPTPVRNDLGIGAGINLSTAARLLERRRA